MSTLILVWIAWAVIGFMIMGVGDINKDEVTNAQYWFLSIICGPITLGLAIVVEIYDKLGKKEKPVDEGGCKVCTNLHQVSRFEVIDAEGRSYTKYGVSNVELSMQDQNKTLKVFLKEKKR